MNSAATAERAGDNVRPILRVLSTLLLIAGMVALGCVAYVIMDTYALHRFESRKLSRSSALPANAVAPSVVTEGDVIGQIEIPRIGLSATIVQGDSDAVLRHAVGHIPETALPGQAGNIALAGHRDTIFRPLRNIQVGDTISLKTPSGEREYQVSSTEVVPPTDVQVLESRGGNELTMITCFPFHYIGHAPNRFIVHAQEKGHSQN